jgi:hypothetical protein
VGVAQVVGVRRLGREGRGRFEQFGFGTGVHAGAPSLVFTCSPHSLAASSSHHQRPARKSSPTADGAGAGRAADAGEKLVVQRVVGDLVQRDVVPDVAPGPVGQRVELDQTLHGLLGRVDQRHLGARARLLAAQPGQPGFLAGQGAAQWLHLANAAAGLAQVDALVHRFLAFAGDETDDGIGLRAVDRQRGVRVRGLLRLELLQQRQGLGVQRAGFQHEDGDRQCMGVDQVGNHHVLGAQAAGLGGGAKLRGLAQQGDCFSQLRVESFRGACIDFDRRGCRAPGAGKEAGGGTHQAPLAKRGCGFTASP